MTIIDDLNALTPAQYQVLRVSFEQADDGIMALWDVRVYNADDRELAVLHPETQPDATLRQALIAWYQDSKAQLENATGLTEYTPEEQP